MRHRLRLEKFCHACDRRRAARLRLEGLRPGALGVLWGEAGELGPVGGIVLRRDIEAGHAALEAALKGVGELGVNDVVAQRVRDKVSSRAASIAVQKRRLVLLELHVLRVLLAQIVDVNHVLPLVLGPMHPAWHAFAIGGAVGQPPKVSLGHGLDRADPGEARHGGGAEAAAGARRPASVALKGAGALSAIGAGPRPFKLRYGLAKMA
mmetsp:Transcript_119721/g.343981  ORF Transcript_119721/g.343981 Transcript_119721/m.343981 type:complete len:208 (-) Transcript_119721:3-626(-)